jgi:TRAP-type C4-dicarboxylate transport system permease small subunit
MYQKSVWLGAARGPIRLATIVFGAITMAIYAWLIFNQFVAVDPIGMHEMIRPEGRPIVQAMLASLSLTLLFGAVYASDIKGVIEMDRTGPFDIFSLILSRLSMAAVAFVVIVMFYEVVTRYIFGGGTLWANEMSLWIAAFVFLFSGLYAMQQRSHIRIYIIYDLFPFWMKKVADIISVALIWFFVYSLVFGSYNNAKAKWDRFEAFGTAWDPPLPATLWPGMLILCCLVALQALANLINDWNDDSTHSPIDDVDEEEIEMIRRAVEEKR